MLSNLARALVATLALLVAGSAFAVTTTTVTIDKKTGARIVTKSWTLGEGGARVTHTTSFAKDGTKTGWDRSVEAVKSDRRTYRGEFFGQAYRGSDGTLGTAHVAKMTQGKGADAVTYLTVQNDDRPGFVRTTQGGASTTIKLAPVR